MRSRDRYMTVQKVAHWTILLLCVMAFPTAQAIPRVHLGDPFGIKPLTSDVLFEQVHIWGGAAVFVLAAILLGPRLTRTAPRLPSDTAGWQRFLAHASHAALFGLLFALPATGILALYASARLGPLQSLLVDVGLALVVFHAAGRAVASVGPARRLAQVDAAGRLASHPRAEWS